MGFNGFNTDAVVPIQATISWHQPKLFSGASVWEP